MNREQEEALQGVFDAHPSVLPDALVRLRKAFKCLACHGDGLSSDRKSYCAACSGGGSKVVQA